MPPNLFQVLVAGDISYTLSGGANYHALTNAPVADLGNTYYVQIQDQSTSLCWDFNMVAVGASIQLKSCASASAPAAFSQTFKLSKQAGVNSDTNRVTGPVASTLSVHYNATMDLCVDSSSVYSLQLKYCKQANAYQTFDLSTPKFTSKGACFASLGGLKTVSKASSCASSGSFALYGGVMPPYTVTPYISPIVTDSGRCLDGSNFGQLIAAKCAFSSGQQWYFQFGQIRNVFNGLCLDAPSANGRNDNAGSVTVKLRACNAFPPPQTQLWIRGSDSILYNAESGNCIRPVPLTSTTDKIVLGTGRCGSTDSLNAYSAVMHNTYNFVMTPFKKGSTCTQPNFRKDLRDLTSDERNSFYNGLNILHSLPSLMGRPERFSDYAVCHAIGAAIYHNSPYFPPWHRAYLRLFEQDLQVVLGNSSFALPYWDWTVDHDDWFDPNSHVLDSNNFGTTGLNNPGPNYCVTDTFSSNWVPVDNNICISRQYTTSTSLNLFSEEFILYMATVDPFSGSVYTSFDKFRQNLEYYPHNNFHAVVAGQGGQIGSVSTSAMDPLFYMHHNNIDRIWMLFQLLQAESNNTNSRNLQYTIDGTVAWPAGSPSLTRTVSTSDMMPCFNIPVSTMMNFLSPAICHVFQPYSGSIVASFQEEDNLNHLFARLQKRHANDKMKKAPGHKYMNVLKKAAHHKGKRHPKEKCKTKKGKRTKPAPMTKEAIKRMGDHMHTVEEQRELEKKADEAYKRLWRATDEALLILYDVDHQSATPRQLAAATQHAIGVLADSHASQNIRFDIPVR